MKISIIFPFYRGIKTVPLLLEKIYEVVKQNGYNYEIIAVNDGSKDDTAFEAIRQWALKNKNLKIIRFKVNAGQTTAIRAGIEHATGDILIPMDSDLENDPADIPLLLAKINEGYDVVSGWRQDRWQGKFFTRKLPSLIANSLISKISGVKLHDYGCTLKAYRREMIQGVPLYGEMHRLIPIYAARLGAKITEIPVRYSPRKFGKSNYGLSRTFRVILDLIVAKFLVKYMDRPIHFFGLAGIGSIFLSFVTGLIALIYRFNGVHFNRTPLPLLTIFFIMMGVQFILMGILAEILIRIYYEPRGNSTYTIQTKINFKNEPKG